MTRDSKAAKSFKDRKSVIVRIIRYEFSRHFVTLLEAETISFRVFKTIDQTIVVISLV